MPTTTWTALRRWTNKGHPMDLNYSAEELAFRDEVRTWLQANLPAVQLSQALDHRQAQAGALKTARQGAVNLRERLKQPGLVCWQDADTGVADCNL